MAKAILLRDVMESDLPIFFEHQLDPAANVMAAFTARDPTDHDAFMAHWAKILADPSIVKQTILSDGRVAGHIGCWTAEEREVGYWLGREFWGQGIATQALSAFVRLVTERPLFAHAAKDNYASLHVLQKCGFAIVGEGRGFANARGAETEEWILSLS
jgi:RimJ/RimL family protein N-acetyltransferase